MRVLLVDDSTTMRKIQRRLLSGLGCNDVLEAGNGKEAMTVLENFDFEFDLVLCDMNMPEMNGIETLTAIRAVTKKLPVVMCTSVAEKSAVMEAIRNGANNYLVKPFAQDVFIAKIKPFLS
ncbi:MAG: response regulator [Victivallales bacterium]|nr:response regulator [Victivallales bacterium]